MIRRPPAIFRANALWTARVPAIDAPKMDLLLRRLHRDSLKAQIADSVECFPNAMRGRVALANAFPPNGAAGSAKLRGRGSPHSPHGRGCGVGRCLWGGMGLGVGVGRIVAVGVAVGVGWSGSCSWRWSCVGVGGGGEGVAVGVASSRAREPGISPKLESRS